LLQERERLSEMAMEALARLLQYQRAQGKIAAAIQTARRLLGIDPLQESVHRVLMRLFAQTGRREAALRQYELCVGLLKRELQLEPELATRTLHLEIQAAAAAPPSPVGLAPSVTGRRALAMAAARGVALEASRAVAVTAPAAAPDPGVHGA